MRKKYIVISLSFLLVAAGLAQDSSRVERQGRVEFSMNISTALRNFSGGSNPILLIDPYLAAFKFVGRNEKHAFRLGLNYNYTTSDEATQTGTRSTVENNQLPIIGFELRDIISRRFEVYYGLDVRGIYMRSNLTTIDFSGPGQTESQLNISKTGMGAGPFIAFVWHPAKRVRIYTEGNFYVHMYNDKRVFIEDNNSATLQDKNVFSILPGLPSSIFVSIRF